MPDKFIHDDFLLQTEEAKRLFNDYAKDMPIVDYHCHLPPQQVAEDTRFSNMAEVWLHGDHYKWRAMRSNGVNERFCTGDASDWEKFSAWAETMPYLLRNPLYHWTHLEMARFFKIDCVLNPETAKEVWEKGNACLQKDEFSARGLMKMSNVRLVCTTDDAIDSLEHHKAVAADNDFTVQMLPTWRPDKGMAVDNPALFNAWVDKLAETSGVSITDFDSYLDAMKNRHSYFHECGCRLSDHGLDTVYAEDYTGAQIKAIFAKVRGGAVPTKLESDQFKSAMLYEWGLMDFERGWTTQLHVSAMRNNNRRLFKQLGPDTGFDSIGDWRFAEPLSKLLGRLDEEGRLSRTILYNLNPRDNEMLATMLGNFQDGSVAGKMQLGSGWWFLDQLDGMKRQIEALSMLGLLSRFVGMLTDSRSFLSYTRHEYFRRILCNILGNDMAQGLIPHDFALVGRMVKDISYNNAARYFGFNLSVEE